MNAPHSTELVTWNILTSIDEPLPVRILEASIDRCDVVYRQIAVEVPRATRNAVVVACRNDEILLVLVSRPVVGKVMWEFPRGFGEPTDGNLDDANTAIRTARRELREECGLSGGRALVLGSVHPDSGFLRQSVNVVEVRGPWSSDVPGIIGEVESHRWITRAALRREILQEKITDSFTLAAFMMAEVQSDIESNNASAGE